MSALDNRIPPPVVAAGCAAAAWFAAPAPGADGVPWAWRLCMALALALAGGAVAAAGSLSFRRAKTTVNPLRPAAASSLVTTGIYRYTRNPMYVGMAAVLAGVAAWLWWAPAWLAPAAFVAYITRFQIRPEERALAHRFGDAYTRYCDQVRRWL